ncbi:CvpA family protein [Methylobrevis pamukkalensis]|uniref:Colicin V production protein n=1 Tax=Methylobrevis pamukkalensis TaxID=1439726 RepID=A0A1E3H1V5_9HYPH|nr:CvpA family protein [Methylobrevis pamukkalensis]ODN70318.1 Colicin V production protein [Methylobrevis pamukkalensis]
MPITLLDGILLVIMMISAVLAMIRGFVREVLSIVSWIAAAAAAFFFYDDLLPYVQDHVAQKQIAVAISAGGIFLLTLLVVSFITMRISDLVLDSRIGALDRTLGFVFGALRGLLLVVVGMMFFAWFMPDESSYPRWIADAKSRPLLIALGDQLQAALPEDPEQEVLDRFRNPMVEEPSSEAPAAPDTGGSTVPPEAGGGPASPDDIDYPQNDQNHLDQLIQSTGQP